jgi:hypothetical protein
MKYDATICGPCDRYDENDDGTCSDTFEIEVSAKNRKELERLRDGVKVEIALERKKRTTT